MTYYLKLENHTVQTSRGGDVFIFILVRNLVGCLFLCVIFFFFFSSFILLTSVAFFGFNKAKQSFSFLYFLLLFPLLVRYTQFYVRGYFDFVWMVYY